ncbi:thioesterase family protein [Sphaerisporangium sp. TRM90804]|uniref:thioesterase family protein n=1 Tax=Sphaerisporangium sp. TRM90804 TaxID=3031113 RepID=UPI00244893AA|nr:thioesterase family protein [Sphaerisporangium sp. TRM90804]MDH2430019.1 thioesterase family protein [Sphaerisporangium sp. TRM90804]
MTKFDEATQAIRVGETLYDVCLDDGYAIGGPLNGGYLLAAVLRAVVDASPYEHPVSTAAQFLRAPRPGPAQVRLEQLKTGRTVAMTRATLVQDGTAYIDTLVTTATLRPGDGEWSAAPAVAMPPLGECVSLPDPKPESNMTLSAQMDLRFDPPTIGWLTGAPTGRPESRAYFRMAEPQDPDPYVLALAVDALPPVAFSAGARGWAPTVELTWHLRALPAPGWLTLIGQGRSIRDGWFDEDVEVWDSAGTLVAQSRQLARLGRG